jgi:hypothetical protein
MGNEASLGASVFDNCLKPQLRGQPTTIDPSRGIIGRGSTETPTNGLSKSCWTRNFHSHSYGRWGIVPPTQSKMMFRLQPKSLRHLGPTQSFIMFGQAPITVTDVEMNFAFGIATRDTGQPKIDWSANNFTMQF